MSVTTTGAGSRLSSGDWSPTTRAWLNGSAGGRSAASRWARRSAMLVVQLGSLGMLVGLLVHGVQVPALPHRLGGHRAGERGRATSAATTASGDPPADLGAPRSGGGASAVLIGAGAVAGLLGGQLLGRRRA